MTYAFSQRELKEQPRKPNAILEDSADYKKINGIEPDEKQSEVI